MGLGTKAIDVDPLQGPRGRQELAVVVPSAIGGARERIEGVPRGNLHVTTSPARAGGNDIESLSFYFYLIPLRFVPSCHFVLVSATWKHPNTWKFIGLPNTWSAAWMIAHSTQCGSPSVDPPTQILW